jgi:hypothetical protein
VIAALEDAAGAVAGEHGTQVIAGSQKGR